VLRGGVRPESFIGRWVFRLLYYRAPEWVFTTAYAAWAVATILTLVFLPPQRKGDSWTSAKRTAFVTGGSGDIGGAIARALAAAGADVAISYVGAVEKATETGHGRTRLGRRSSAVQLDQRDPKAIEAAAAKVVAEFGRIDILVNNAAWNIGIPSRSSIR
jgi:hypothetical protein